MIRLSWDGHDRLKDNFVFNTFIKAMSLKTNMWGMSEEKDSRQGSACEAVMIKRGCEDELMLKPHKAPSKPIQGQQRQEDQLSLCLRVHLKACLCARVWTNSWEKVLERAPWLTGHFLFQLTFTIHRTTTEICTLIVNSCLRFLGKHWQRFPLQTQGKAGSPSKKEKLKENGNEI